MNNTRIKMITRMVTLFLLSHLTIAAPTELGNGNDGKDLLEFREVTEGIIFETRTEAVNFLSKINLRGIQGLGYLKDEVEKTKLLIARDGLTPQELLDLGAFKTGNNPVVYARTFPRPHAPTRFFPAAQELSRNQLVTLHIHEGLHRALPESIRTNEEIVEEITKVITTPNSTFEDIVAVMDEKLPVTKKTVPTEVASSPSAEMMVSEMEGNSDIGFFKDNFVKYETQSFSDNALQLWTSSTILSGESTFWKGKNWSVRFLTKLYSFDNQLDTVSNDRMIRYGVRIENKVNDDRTWGYQYVSTGSVGSYLGRNPLSRSLSTLQVDLKKSYINFDLIVKGYITGASTTDGSLELIKDPNLTVKNGNYFEELNTTDRDISFVESDFGSILSFSIGAKKSWNENLDLGMELDFHKMSSYASRADEQIPDSSVSFGYRTELSDNSVGSIPMLSVIKANADYKLGDFSLIARYYYLLNRPTDEKLNEITLTTLGDPTGRGLGKSGFSVAAAYNF